MTEYDNSNRIALWENDKRDKSTHPHLNGQGETDEEVWASAWFSDEINDDDKKLLQGILKRYNSKRPFISISLKSKEVSHNQGMSNAKTAANPGDNFDDDIPF